LGSQNSMSAPGQRPPLRPCLGPSYLTTTVTTMVMTMTTIGSIKVEKKKNEGKRNRAEMVGEEQTCDTYRQCIHRYIFAYV
jgi:hypothetical protein